MRVLSLPLVLILAACNKSPEQTAPVELEWTLGQQFYVASTDELVSAGGPTDGIDLKNPASAVPGGASWTEEHVWTYQVVEADFVPDAKDTLYEFAVDSAGRTVPLTVLRATLDPALNPEDALLASEPTVYLVFRARRNRLAGIVQFTTVDGDRLQQAWSARELNRSVGTLTQSRLALAPTYLAPFGARWNDDERVLEDGSLVTSMAVDRNRVDVFFDEELGGQLVSTRYEAGRPWPTWTVTDGHESRLLTRAEVSKRRGLVPVNFDGVGATEELDYRSALASAPDMDASRRISDEQIAAGGISWETMEGRRPWAGYWWPTQDGELVFGYDERPTFAQRIRDEVDEAKAELEPLADEGKYTEWGRRNAELNEVVTGFYDDLQADLDGGRLRVEDGRVVGTGSDGESWDYAIDDLSPIDKWALARWLSAEDWSNPFHASAWEIMNSYTPTGEGWWGHCNGWAAAAVLTQQPTEDRTVTVAGTPILFTSADQKGLLTEMHYGVSTNFFGARYSGPEDDVNDLTPEAFMAVMGHFLGDLGVSVVVDATATEQVWNYPAWKVDMVLKQLEDRSGRVNVNTATLEDLTAMDEVGPDEAMAILRLRDEGGAIQDLRDLEAIPGLNPGEVWELFTLDPVQRVLHTDIRLTLVTDAVGPEHVDLVEDSPMSEFRDFGATLELDADGRIVGGRWDDPEKHPDFAWSPWANATYWTDSRSENSYVKYGHYLDTFGAENVER